MNDLIDLLRILTETETRQLRRCFNNLEAGIKDSRLGQFLLDIIISNENGHQTNEDIHKGAIAEFGKAFIKNRSRKLFDFIEKFVFNNWLDNEANKIVELKVKKEFLLLDYYKTKQAQTDELASNGIANLIQKKSKAINKLLKANQTDYLLQNFHIYTIKNFEYFTAQHSFSSEGAERLENTINSLDTFYTTAKLKLMCEAYVFEKISGADVVKLFIDTILPLNIKIVAKQKTTDRKHILLKIYALIFIATQNLTHKNLQEAKKAISTNIKELNDDELSHIITLMINLVAVLKRSKNIDLTKLSYELIKYGLKRKIFLVDGKINPLIILNYLFLSIEIENKTDLKIVEEYYGNIKPTLRDAIIKLKNAVDYFIKGDYKAALKTCSGRLSNNIEFQIYRKLLFVMCNYELKDFEMVEITRTDLLRHAGRHKKELATNFHTAIRNFCSTIKNLIKVNIDTEQLLLSVKKEKFILMKRWLLRKLKGL